MDKSKAEPVVLPDVHDPMVPLSELIPNRTGGPTPPNPNAGPRQPQSHPQDEPPDPIRDADIGGGD
jgi:hypothetical protein